MGLSILGRVVVTFIIYLKIPMVHVMIFIVQWQDNQQMQPRQTTPG